MAANDVTPRQIFDAIGSGDDEFVINAIQEHRRVFEAEGWRTCLAAAVDAGRLRLVERFVEAGAAVNPPHDGSTDSDENLVDRAAAEGHLEIVRWLLDHGANVNQQVDGKRACEAVPEAASRGHLSIVRLLVERGAEVNSIHLRLTALDWAVVYRHKEVADFLRSVGGKHTDGFVHSEPVIPPLVKEGRSAVEGKPLGKWRTLFESTLRPAGQRDYGTEYAFGLPATADQLTAVETALRVPLPADLREMLGEFNGIWTTTTTSRQQEYPPTIAYLDADHMAAKVPEYLANSDNPLPGKKSLRKVVWVAQSNGFADLWGVCVEAVGKHPAGAVVRLDHEVGKLEPCRPNLAEFVRLGRFDDDK